MKTFVYTGPNTSATLKLEGGKELDAILVKNRKIELPEDHPYIKALLAQKLLKLADDPPAADAPAQPKKSAKGA